MNIFSPADQVADMVRKQIEYYFSAENLVKDTFLRRSMDNDGFIPITVLAGFPRVQVKRYTLVRDRG